MSTLKGLKSAALASLLAVTLNASAAVVTLDFEGIGSGAMINGFYNGGTDSQGNAGVNYGVAFGASAMALRESDPLANFALAPSPETIMFFGIGGALVNVDAGFTSGFSFWYTNVQSSGSVLVYSGLNGSGSLLGTISILALEEGPSPGNPFSTWAVGSVAFSGMARSAVFNTAVNEVGFDNLTFGSTNPNPTPQPTPEPGSLALAALALAALAVTAGARRRKG